MIVIFTWETQKSSKEEWNASGMRSATLGSFFEEFYYRLIVQLFLYAWYPFLLNKYIVYLSNLIFVGKSFYRLRDLNVNSLVYHKRPLRHDNAPSDTSFIVAEYLAKHSLATLPQSPYCPYIAPLEYFLLPMIKTEIKCQHFGMLEDAK